MSFSQQLSPYVLLFPHFNEESKNQAKELDQGHVSHLLNILILEVWVD